MPGMNIPLFFKKKKSPIEKDLALVKCFLKGEKTAHATLHTLIDALLEKALTTLASKGTFFNDRENTKQDILVEILTANDSSILRNFRGQSRLSTYLWSIIRFKLIDKLRQERVAAERTLPLSENLSYEAQYTQFELVDLVKGFIGQASNKEAFILEKRWLEELDYHSICKLGERNGFSISLSEIGNILFKKRKELMEYLKRQGYVIDKQMNKHIKTK